MAIENKNLVLKQQIKQLIKTYNLKVSDNILDKLESYNKTHYKTLQDIENKLLLKINKNIKFTNKELNKLNIFEDNKCIIDNDNNKNENEYNNDNINESVSKNINEIVSNECINENDNESVSNNINENDKNKFINDNVKKEFINDNNLHNENKELKINNFKLSHENNDYKNKIKNYKCIIKDLNKKLLEIKNNSSKRLEKNKILFCTNNSNSNNSNSNNSDSDNENVKFYIDYYKVPELSIRQMQNILLEHDYKYENIKNLHSHILKQMINRLNNNKMERKFNK